MSLKVNRFFKKINDTGCEYRYFEWTQRTNSSFFEHCCISVCWFSLLFPNTMKFESLIVPLFMLGGVCALSYNETEAKVEINWAGAAYCCGSLGTG
jgi:hypothetical protein